jgi:hypothetical protein
VHEYILAILTRQKAKTLRGVEPLYCSCFFHVVPFLTVFVAMKSWTAVEDAYGWILLIEGFKRVLDFDC